jgi:3-deoxy-D-manno-octulosonic-acid transferase
VRIFYNLLIYLLMLPLAIFWVVRGIGNRAYLSNVGQRFGFGFPKINRCIWLHAVSVGEVQAAVPLIRSLQERFPERELLITTVTPTGAARVKALFGDSVHHCYIPFEFPHAVKRFFGSVNAEAALIMETEIWPNLYRGCGIRRIPLILVSARVSPKSVPGYRKLLPLIRETLSHGIIIAAQSQSDADRFLELGANPARTRVMGNIKFDVEADADVIEKGKALREDLFGGRPVWIAASTHEGEEQLVLQAHRRLLERFPNLLFILVPRHPERFSVARELIEKAGLSMVARTENSRARDEAVFLCDTMGEVPLFYAASDVAFVAGSLVPIGGHNLLEPASLGVPIITGPHNFNAQDIADLFVEMGACRKVEDSSELVETVSELLSDPEKAARLGNAGRTVLEENRGALERLLVLLEPLLKPAPGD